MFEIFSLFIANVDDINASNHGKWALLSLICGNIEIFVTKTSNSLVPQPNLMNSKDPSTICHKFSASNARMLAQDSMSHRIVLLRHSM